jgi:hypothetical protein
VWKQSSRWILSSAVNFAGVHLWFRDTILFNVWWSLSLSFCFQPLFLLGDDVITLETAALDTPNKEAILVTDAPAKCAPTICPLKIWEVYHFAVLSYKLLLNTICNALTLALHSTSKQKNNKRYNQCYFSAAHTNSFIPILSSVSIICPSRVHINSTMCVCCHSATQTHKQGTYITGMIEVTNSTI